MLNAVTLILVGYTLYRTTLCEKRDSALTEALGTTLAQLLRQGDNAVLHADEIAADLSDRYARADAIDGSPGEAADAASKSGPSDK